MEAVTCKENVRLQQFIFLQGVTSFLVRQLCTLSVTCTLSLTQRWHTPYVILAGAQVEASHQKFCQEPGRLLGSCRKEALRSHFKISPECLSKQWDRNTHSSSQKPAERRTPSGSLARGWQCECCEYRHMEEWSYPPEYGCGHVCVLVCVY